MQEINRAATTALSTIEKTIRDVERERQTYLRSLQSIVREKTGEIMANKTELQSIAERIDRLVLYQQLLRNIRMNLATFQRSNVCLRPNQLNSVHKLVEFLRCEGYGKTSGYIRQPTGAGKTVLFGVIARLCDVSTLILVPRTNLLHQTKKELVDIVKIPENKIGLVGGGTQEFEKPIQIATYQSHQSLIDRNKRYLAKNQSRQLIICDEAHRALGKRTQESLDVLNGEFDELLTEEEQGAENNVLENLQRYAPARALKLGFTATPKLADKHVEDAFGHKIAEEKHADLVRSGILVPYRIVHTDGTITDEDLEEGDFSLKKEVEVLRRENAYQKLIGEYMEILTQYKKARKKHQYPLRGIAFCVSIAECDRFASEAKRLGLKTRTITSRETKDLNQVNAETLLSTAEQQLLNQDIDLIITVTKLAEGWNFPPANAAIWARASQSPALIMQGVGRTARAYEDTAGNKKDFSYVFETDWQLRGTSRRRMPLKIADALAQMGERPDDCCKMANGTKLSYAIELGQVDEFGRILIDGVECIGIERYCVNNHLDREALRRHITKIGLTPFGKAKNGNRIIDVYEKEMVDNLEFVLRRKQGVCVGENGELTINGEQWIAINRFCDFTGLNERILRREIASAQLTPRHEALSQGNRLPIPLYQKDAVMRLEYVQIQNQQLDANGVVNINGMHCVGIRKFTKTNGLDTKQIWAEIASGGIQKCGRAMSVKNPIDVYALEEILELPYMQQPHIKKRVGKLISTIIGH